MPKVISRKQWGAQQEERRLQAAAARRLREGEGGERPPHGFGRRLLPIGRARAWFSGSAAFTATRTAGTTSATTRSSTGSGTSTRDGPAGSSRAVIGAQAQGVNAQTTGVAALGTHTSTPVSGQARKALVRWLVWKLPEHGLDGKGKARMVSAGGDTCSVSRGREVPDPPDHRPPRDELHRMSRRRTRQRAIRSAQEGHPRDRRELGRRGRLALAVRLP